MESRLTKVNVHEVQQKIGSKKELHSFLIQECGAYLPKIGCCNIYFLRSIIDGSKEHLKRKDIVIAAVPQIEGLTAEDFLDHAKSKPSILRYLPDQCDWLHLDKQWICDVLLTLDTDGVNDMIQQAKLKRRERLDASQSLLVHMKPEFAEALRRSVNFSVHKGRSAHLIKQGTSRKRKTEDLEEVKEEEKELRGSKQKYLQDNKRIREEFGMMQEQLQEMAHYKGLVHQLHDTGIIDDNGNILSVVRDEQHELMS